MPTLVREPKKPNHLLPDSFTQIGKPKVKRLNLQREKEKRNNVVLKVIFSTLKTWIFVIMPWNDKEYFKEELTPSGQCPHHLNFMIVPFPCAPVCMQIALWSLKKAQRRLLSGKRKRESPDEDEQAEIKDAESSMQRTIAQASELGDIRPLTICQYSPDGLQLATGSISGTVKIWDMPSITTTLTIQAHDCRVTGQIFLGLIFYLFSSSHFYHVLLYSFNPIFISDWAFL